LWLKFKLPSSLSSISSSSLSYYYYPEVTVKISKFLWITGIINRALKPSQVQKHIRLKIYITLWHYLVHYTDAKPGQLENRINPGRHKQK
jgi:hypothetical protein